MAVYSNAQLQTLARSVGVPEKHVPLMAAIALAESSGRTDAINPGRGAGGRPTREYSVGLWQINTLVHKRFTVDQLKDPANNASEMIRIYRTEGLRAWGAYTDGRYKRYMQGASANVYVPSVGSDPISAPSSITSGGFGTAALVGLAVIAVMVLFDD